MHTFSDIQKDLESMGIRERDTLLVHSSLKSIGEVEGGADGILDVLMGYLSKGLLVFPALSYSSVNAQSPEYSVNDTPACVGVLPELFRKRPGVIRSWHPTHSVTAFGSDALSFIEGHERFNTPCARMSPWGRIVDRDGKILFIGCGIACNTMLHGVEEWFGAPNMFTAYEEPLVTVTPDGRRISVPSRRHTGQRSRFYAKLEPVFLSFGAMTTGSFGDAACYLANAPRMADVTMTLLVKDPDMFGHDRAPDTHQAKKI
jgi:aminoglycoside 3-N-acetyltransferase